MRGGARSGAGRKSKLTSFEALAVGGYCETLWQQAAEDQAMARYEADPTTKNVRQEQVRSDLIPKSRGGKRRMNPDITESIDDITAGKRAVSIPLKRPYGARAKILADVVEHCRVEYGRIISPSKAAECWKQFKKFQKSPEYKASLNST